MEEKPGEEKIQSPAGGPRRRALSRVDLVRLLEDSENAPAHLKPALEAAPLTQPETGKQINQPANLQAEKLEDQVGPISSTLSPPPTGSTESPKRRKASLSALDGLLEAASGPSPAETTETPRKRRIADLSALDGYKESTPSTPQTESKSSDQPASRPRRRTTDLSALDGLKDAAVLPSPAARPAPASRRRTADLSSLDALLSTPAGDSPQTPTSEPSEPTLNIPPELEDYLSPDLWRRLTTGTPPRGVLINALERTRSVQYLISTYIPYHLVQEKMRHPVPGLVKGEELNGTLLFSDVSGFTALSERLAVLGVEGAERLTSIMNRYFSAMLDILAWSGGILLKFAGDATLVYFPEQENGQQAQWAVRAAQRMLRAMNQFSSIDTPTEAVHLTMKIGIATGHFLAASVGSARRMEYAVLGPAVRLTMGAEGSATGAGQLIFDATTRSLLESSEHISDHPSGYFRLPAETGGELDDFEIKAEARRARGAIPWSASPQEIIGEIEVVLRQIEALRPYIPDTLVERTIIHARRRRFESEYRPTTILFCNFTGFDALYDLWGLAGISRLTSLLSAYFAGMQQIIARYGGIVSRIDPYSKGTKLLGLFGALVAHEDDPERAVGAALAMNSELDTLNDIWRRKLARHLPPEAKSSASPIPLIQHRIGITNGQTFAGQVGSSTRREYTVMGDEVNLAARLMGAAEMGQILVDRAVAEAVEDSFVLTTLPAIRVKGKSRPIPIFQAEGPREDTLATRARRREALIGREEELAQAQAILHQAFERPGRVLTLHGPAGIGKSHLADMLVASAWMEGAQVFFSQCRSFSANTPYASWRPLLRNMAAIHSYDYHPRVQQEKLEGLLHSLGLEPGLSGPLGALMGVRRADSESPARLPSGREHQGVGEDLDQSGLMDMLKQRQERRRSNNRLDVWEQIEQQTQSSSGAGWNSLERITLAEAAQLQNAVEAVLTAQAARQPFMLFFEDAHWMDAASHELLHALQGRLAQLPVCVLLARRTETHVNPLGGEAMQLVALTADGTAALMAHLMLMELSEVVFEQSQGNPLFIKEITRWLQRSQNLNATDLRTALRSSNVLQKLVLSSLESLPPEQREVARLAAVVGTEFRTGEVAALLQDTLDTVTLRQALRDLTRSRILGQQELGTDPRYIFQQALVRDILYNSLPFEQRRELHGRLAEYLCQPSSRRRVVQSRIVAALEPGPAPDPSQEAENIAGHFEKAQLWQPAARHYFQAGEQARSQGRLPSSAELTSQAQACLQKVDREALTLGEEIQALDALQGAVFSAQGDLALLNQDFPTAVAAYEQARKLAEQLAAITPDDPTQNLALAGLLFRLGLVLPTAKHNEQAASLFTRLLEWEPALPGDLHTATALALAWVTASPPPARVTEGSSLLQATRHHLLQEWLAAEQAYLSASLPAGAVLMALHKAEQAKAQEDLALCRDCLQRARTLLLDTPQPGYLLAYTSFLQATLNWQAGEIETARTLLDDGLAALETASLPGQVDARRCLRQALKTVNTGRPRRWPTWQPQAYEDALIVGVLFQVYNLHKMV